MTWLQLAPFMKSVIAYFVIGSFEFFDSNVLSTILKCVPIICLICFIIFTDFKFTKEYRYHQMIVLGLVFSCAGDALLDYKNGILFPLGMMAFGFAQVCYISAFGWKPLRLIVGMMIYIFGVYGKLNLSHFMQLFYSNYFVVVSLMFKNFEGVLVYGVPIYGYFLTTMVWRANSRTQGTRNLPKLLGAIGGILFAISDGVIAFNKFYAPIEYSGAYIMVTYYIAQLGITLSTLDHDLMPKSSVKNN